MYLPQNERGIQTLGIHTGGIPSKSGAENLVVEMVEKFFSPIRQTRARMAPTVSVQNWHASYYFDVSIVSSISVEVATCTFDTVDGRADEFAEICTSSSYPKLCLTPFIVEDHGELGECTRAFGRLVAPSFQSPQAPMRAVAR